MRCAVFVDQAGLDALVADMLDQHLRRRHCVRAVGQQGGRAAFRSCCRVRRGRRTSCTSPSCFAVVGIETLGGDEIAPRRRTPILPITYGLITAGIRPALDFGERKRGAVAGDGDVAARPPARRRRRTPAPARGRRLASSMPFSVRISAASARANLAKFSACCSRPCAASSSDRRRRIELLPLAASTTARTAGLSFSCCNWLSARRSARRRRRYAAPGGSAAVRQRHGGRWLPADWPGIGSQKQHLEPL